MNKIYRFYTLLIINAAHTIYKQSFSFCAHSELGVHTKKKNAANHCQSHLRFDAHVEASYAAT